MASILEKLISALVGLGVPGFILFVLVTSGGLTGAASSTAALAALGPGGMVGGLVTAGVLGLVAAAVAEYGMLHVLSAVIAGFLKAATSKADLLAGLAKVKFFLKEVTCSVLVGTVDES